MTYKDQYKALPANAQKVIRDLMTTLSECRQSPIIIHGTECQSEMETAIGKVKSVVREIDDYRKRPKRY